jgi:GT2 family glycosyltransferase
MDRISIVILNYNGKHHLEQFLPSVIQHSQGHEIVVADNHSSDGSVTMLKLSFPGVKVLEFDQNYGFCGGYNRALAQLNADYFVILNSDIEVTKNWIEPVISLFRSDKKIAAIQPKLLDFHHKDRFEYAGGAGGFIDRFGYPFCRGRIFDTIEQDTGQYDDSTEIFWASGACMFIKASLFGEYGGFDESFFAHMEEIDLCWSMKEDGYKVYYCGNSTVFHVGGGTLTYSNPRKTYLNFRNSLMVIIKHLPVRELVWKLPFRWAMDYIAVLHFWFLGNFWDGFMILKAHIFIIKNFLSTSKKRKKRVALLRNQAGIYRAFLLFSYHISGLKKYSDLRF